MTLEYPVFIAEHRSVCRSAGQEVRRIAEIISQVTSSQVHHLIGDNVDLSEFPPHSIIIIVGQATPCLARARADLFIVFMCLSAFYNASGDSSADSSGLAFLKKRQEMVESNIIPYIDALIDYYPRHCNRLRLIYEPHHISVDWYPVVPAVDPIRRNAAQYEYDVCFVGNPSERRAKISKDLTRLGLKLSPEKTDQLSDTMQRSKIVINAHRYAHDNIELPRILLALSVGVPLISEPCFGLSDIIPEGIIKIAKYDDIALASIDLLENDLKRSRLSQQSSAWIRDVYLKICSAHWRFLIDKFNRLSSQKFNRY